MDEIPMANKLLVQAVQFVADLLAVHALQQNRVRITERDDLQPVATQALKEFVAGQADPVQVRTAVHLNYADYWSCLGPVDIVLSDQQEATFLELKCGSDMNTLGPCAWDVLKCALALRQGDASDAYLLAATTQALWRRPIRGAEFFMAAHEWTVTELKNAFEDWWRKWEKEGYAPRRVPAYCATELVTAAPFQIGTSQWELRLARVWTNVVNWHEWQSFAAS
jgi:hypothetical protein